MSESLLLHFTGSKTFLDYISKNSNLRMNHLANVNDPKEAKHWPFAFYTRSRDISETQSLAAAGAFQDNLTHRTQILCFAETKAIEGRIDLTFPSMWWHYADRHRGICLIFDKEILVSAAKDDIIAAGASTVMGSVTYHSAEDLFERDALHITYTDAFLHDPHEAVDAVLGQWPSLLTRKHSHWECESEFRIIARHRDQTNLFVDIGSSLRGVAVGNDISEDDFRAILAICKHDGIPLYVVAWNGSIAHVCGDHTKEDSGIPTINLDGCSYSTTIPTTHVWVFASDKYGQPVPLLVRTTGDLILGEWTPRWTEASSPNDVGGES